jgi:peptidoglycan/LPS O-acetylase OafA/YrhL
VAPPDSRVIVCRWSMLVKQDTISGSRNDTVDALRIVAAFCVVAAHASYAEDPTVIEVQVRLMALWTYPFFFLLTLPG